MEKGHPRNNTAFLFVLCCKPNEEGKNKSINHLFIFFSVVLIDRLGVNTGLEIILRLAPVELFGETYYYVLSLKKALSLPFFSSRTPIVPDNM